MKFVKKAFLWLLLFMIQMPSLPVEAFGTGSGGYVYYNRATTVYPVLNADTYNDSSFLNSVVGTGNKSAYNIAPAFTKESRSKGASSMPTHIDYDTSFKHKNDDNTYRVYYQYEFEEALKAPARKGDLRICYSANLKNDKHWNFDRHWDSWTAYPTTWAGTYSKNLIVHDTGDTHSDTTVTLGRNTFVPVGTNPYQDKLYFGAIGQVCTCGSSKVSNINIMLADTAGPRVESIYTTRLKPDGTMENFTDFKGGDTLYINLKFNEDIRFADDMAMLLTGAPKLRFRVKRIGDNIEQTGLTLTADLVSLDGDTLTFKYTVPATFTVSGQTVLPNYYINEVYSYSDSTYSTWIKSTKDFDLKLFGKNTGNVNYLGVTRKTTSRIVDLAGNPMDTAGSTTALQAPAYMDNVPPSIRKIDIVRTGDTNPQKIDKSDVYARIGEKIGFFVYFSEEMLYARKSDGALLRPDLRYWGDTGVLGYDMTRPYGTSLIAELNIEKDGTPVTAVAKYITAVQDGINGPKVSRVYFELEEPVSGDMLPLTYASGRQFPIGVNRIYLGTGGGEYAFADARGNYLNETTEYVNTTDGARVMPAQQLWLDAVPPAANTSLHSGSYGYTPMNYAGGEDSPEFYFPVSVYDQYSVGEAFRSGVEGVTGSFTWRDTTEGNSVDYTYEYAVTGSADKPADSAYKTGVTGKPYAFTQISAGNYIHLRLLDDVEYNIGSSELVVNPVDNAGNTGETAFGLNYQMDRTGPKITRESFDKNYNAGSGGSITTVIGMRDVSGIEDVEYQWTLLGTEPSEEDWTAAGSVNSGTFSAMAFAETVAGSVYGETFSGMASDETVAENVYGELFSGAASAETVTESVYGAPLAMSSYGIMTGSYKTCTFILGNLGPSNHQYTLHVRAADSLGYTSAASFDFEYDLTLPKYNIEFVSDPKLLLPKHSVKLSFTQDAGFDSKAAEWLLVLVKKPGASDQYWARTFKYNNGDIIGKENAIDLFDVGPDAGGWTSAVHHEHDIIYYDEKNGYTYGDYYEQTALDSQGKAELYAFMNQSYRQVELTVIAWKPLLIYSPETKIPDDEFRAQDTYTFNFASGSAIGQGNAVHRADITPKTAVSYTRYYAPFKVVTSLPYNDLQMPSSLDGGVFNVALSNLMVSAYGIEDIDFDSTDTNFALYKTGAEETPLFTAPLIPKASQDITIPAGVALETGNYKAVVSIRSKASGTSGHIDKYEYANINIDRRQLDTYGVTQVRTRVGSGYPDYAYPDYAVTAYPISPGNRAAEVLASGDLTAGQTITFKAENLLPIHYGSYSEYAAFIRVWSETANDVNRTGPGLCIPTGYYSWIYFTGELEYTTYYLHSVYYDTIINNLFSSTPYYAATIPIVPGENIIKYQIAFASTGYMTPVQTLRIQAGDSKPTIKIKLSPDKAGGATSSGVTASVDSVSSEVVSPETLQVSMAGDASLAADFAEDRQVTLTKNGGYYFCVYDKYHNFGFQKVTIDYIDMDSPSLAVTNLSDEAANTFGFKAEMADSFDTGTCKLYIGFDEAYCSVLGVEPGTVYEVPGAAAQWLANAPSASGIYSSQVTSADGKKTVIFSGAFKYDGSDASETVPRTVTLYAVDGAGNKSEEYTVTLNTRNEPAKYASGRLEGGGFTADFTKPVLLTMPDENALKPVYSQTKAYLPFFSNGAYAVQYSDIFGDCHKEDIHVDQYDSLYNCIINISETAPTNENVTVLINAAFNKSITVEPPGSIDGAVIEPAYNGTGDVVGASVTVAQNGTISFGLKPKDSAYPTQTRTVVVGNIDKDPPAVSIDWAYTANVVDGMTAGEIIASLKADEELQPLETGTMHTFTLDDQAPYTFEYEDLAGNKGSITATPPAKIVEKTRVELDTTPPDYEFSVYKSMNGASMKVKDYSREEYEALADKTAAFPLFSGVMQLRFDITDENQTRLSIKNGPIDGVSLAGNTVTLSANADFTVVITDANNNRTEVPISITKADNTPPTGMVTYVNRGEYVVRGYLAITDNAPGEFTLKNTWGVMIDTEPGEYQGKYYHEFLDNESFTFLFTDTAGNNGSVTAAVTSLDMGAPVGTVSQWVPYFIDSNGVAHKGVLSDTVTNSDVSVYLRFNKTIRTLTPAIMDGKGALADISISQEEDSATVVFRRNAKVKLTYAALNNRIGSLVLEVGIIDKTAPVITAVKTSAGTGAATYTFNSDEEVFFEGEDASEARTSYSKTFELNGDYDFKFTDMAGNSSICHLTVSGIDRVAPGVSIKDLPATKEGVQAYNQANGTSIGHTLTNEPVTIKASLDEAGNIRFRGVSYTVAEDEWVPLTVDYNGIYEIVATDLAGMATRYSFKIDCIDKTEPQVLLPGGTLSVRQGISMDDFKAMVLANVIVSDNADPSPAVAVSSSPDTGQLNTPGIYPVGFTASDAAGNGQTASFYVRVYAADALEVLVNGKASQPDETLFIGVDDSRSVQVEVKNLPGGPSGSEPYKMYWKQGLNTPGQMKDAPAFSGGFAAPEDDFYTLYIVTQSRTSYITYIYVQQ